MRKPNVMVPLSATALIALLAGCGGGGTEGAPISSDSSVKAETAGTLPQVDAPTAGQAPAGTPSAEQIATQSATEAAGGIAGVLPKVASAGTDAADDQASGDQAAALAVTNTDTTSSRPAISHADGVQGAALMTMLFQKACAEPRQTNGLYGPHLGEAGDGLPRIFADLRLSPENYQLIGWQKPLFDTVCDPKFATFRLPQAGEGKLTLSSNQHWIHDYLNRPAPKRAFNPLNAQIPISHAKWVILKKDITVNGQALSSESNGFAFNPFTHTGIGFGVLTEWKQGEQNLRLMLLPGTQDNEAKLCWNANLASVKRLQCTTWQAPEGWQPGQMLTVVDQYIVDDRSAYPNDSGMLFLHSKSY
ncbi:MAG: hypothetical protein Q4B17_04615 [Lautropia sp.]|nr:hypothetical protein [Lautropia sp.]